MRAHGLRPYTMRLHSLLEPHAKDHTDTRFSQLQSWPDR
jgi:hypothetical protein